MEFTVEQEQKFALLAFSGLTIAIHEGTPNPADLGFRCWSLGKLPFTLDPWWRDQLGKVVADQLDRCNFVLLTKQQATSGDAFGEESRILRNRMLFLMQGLAVSAGVPRFDLGRLIYGAVFEPNRPKIAFARFPQFYRTAGANKPSADLATLQSAARFSHHLEEAADVMRRDSLSHYRLASGIEALRDGFSSPQSHVRLHQFVRAIEACLPAEQVRGKEQFADYASTFLSQPEALDTRLMLLQMYDLRSAAEHHRRFDQRALPDVADPDFVAMRRTRQAEAFARELYRRFLATEADHLHIFQNDGTLEEFWKDKAQVRSVWGDPFELNGIS